MSLQVAVGTILTADMPQTGTEQDDTAAILLLVKVQAASASKVAVIDLVLPSAGKVTPTKVCVVVPSRLVTLSVAVALPLNTKLPVVGALAKVTVTSAV